MSRFGVLPESQDCCLRFPIQMARSLLPVNYTTNSTDQTQQQMDEVMDTFGALMGTVVADFKGLSSNYVAQLRSDLAAARVPGAGMTAPAEFRCNAPVEMEKWQRGGPSQPQTILPPSTGVIPCQVPKGAGFFWPSKVQEQVPTHYISPPLPAWIHSTLAGGGVIFGVWVWATGPTPPFREEVHP